jgi:hypothetical protein
MEKDLSTNKEETPKQEKPLIAEILMDSRSISDIQKVSLSKSDQSNEQFLDVMVSDNRSRDIGHAFVSRDPSKKAHSVWKSGDEQPPSLELERVPQLVPAQQNPGSEAFKVIQQTHSDIGFSSKYEGITSFQTNQTQAIQPISERKRKILLLRFYKILHSKRTGEYRKLQNDEKSFKLINPKNLPQATLFMTMTMEGYVKFFDEQMALLKKELGETNFPKFEKEWDQITEKTYIKLTEPFVCMNWKDEMRLFWKHRSKYFLFKTGRDIDEFIERESIIPVSYPDGFSSLHEEVSIACGRFTMKKTYWKESEECDAVEIMEEIDRVDEERKMNGFEQISLIDDSSQSRDITEEDRSKSSEFEKLGESQSEEMSREIKYIEDSSEKEMDNTKETNESGYYPTQKMLERVLESMKAYYESITFDCEVEIEKLQLNSDDEKKKNSTSFLWKLFKHTSSPNESEKKEQEKYLVPYLIPIIIEKALILKIKKEKESFRNLMQEYSRRKAEIDPIVEIDTSNVDLDSMSLPFQERFKAHEHDHHSFTHKMIQNYGNGVFSEGSQICIQPKNCYCSNEFRIMICKEGGPGFTCEESLTLPLEEDYRDAEREVNSTDKFVLNEGLDGGKEHTATRKVGSRNRKIFRKWTSEEQTEIRLEHWLVCLYEDYPEDWYQKEKRDKIKVDEEANPVRIFVYEINVEMLRNREHEGDLRRAVRKIEFSETWMSKIIDSHLKLRTVTLHNSGVNDLKVSCFNLNTFGYVNLPKIFEIQENSELPLEFGSEFDYSGVDLKMGRTYPDGRGMIRVHRELVPDRRDTKDPSRKLFLLRIQDFAKRLKVRRYWDPLRGMAFNQAARPEFYESAFQVIDLWQLARPTKQDEQRVIVTCFSIPSKDSYYIRVLVSDMEAHYSRMFVYRILRYEYQENKKKPQLVVFQALENNIHILCLQLEWELVKNNVENQPILIRLCAVDELLAAIRISKPEPLI